ncbi:Pentatricopeptide repeat-containing protein [Platanthera zijinensis]|uniref:Pentatricopeptide repeat-containing protein n=1 Tax=Platanthera zijinensis TaxID=2320716 RepID=A0AAP0BVV2_9ASPA
MAIFSAARSRRTLHPSRLVPRLSISSSTISVSETTSAASIAPSPLSPATAKFRLLKEYDPDKALSIISSVLKPSSSPASSRYAVDLTVRRLAAARRFADVESLLESRKSDPAASQESFLTTIIIAYGSAGMLDKAISTFNDIPRLCSAPPTTLSFNALLTSAVRAKKHAKVSKLFSELSETHSISPDTVSYGVLIKSLCLSGKLGKAFEILKVMGEKGIEVSNFIYTSLLDSLYKRGESKKAEELWNEMVERGCKPDLPTYNVKIMSQALHGSPEDVLESISNLEAAGLKPDTITYNYLMTCYSRCERFDNILEVYNGLKKMGCMPNATTFKLMLNLLREKGDFDSGFDIFKDSLKHNRIPDFQTLRPFVVGLAKNSKVEEAKMVIRAVRKMFPDNLVGRWKVVEEELGLNADGHTSCQVELLKA